MNRRWIANGVLRIGHWLSLFTSFPRAARGAIPAFGLLEPVADKKLKISGGLRRRISHSHFEAPEDREPISIAAGGSLSSRHLKKPSVKNPSTP
jgi:hypothetical protein